LGRRLGPHLTQSFGLRPVSIAKNRTETLPNFRPISIVAKRLDAMETGLSPNDCVRWGPSLLPKRGQTPNF